MLYGHVHDTMDQRLIEQFQGLLRDIPFESIEMGVRFLFPAR